ncbi:hypothetical protein [Candidatus Tisiphia endosymbiont of Beris chalybata]|uniref:hypothetical protein n=1 Tax=Candidatus Tisiphia endosymbiont of Beris chalybata TaxID=3066262 RepID=UPI00312C9A79
MLQKKNYLELKALHIVGPYNVIDPEIEKLYKENKNCLIIGDGAQDKPLTFENIGNNLEKNNVKIGPNTRIDILAHGNRIGNKHMMQLDDLNPNACCYTENFFTKLRELANCPLYIHLWACYGGSANKDASRRGFHFSNSYRGKRCGNYLFRKLCFTSFIKPLFKTKYNPISTIYFRFARKF